LDNDIAILRRVWSEEPAFFAVFTPPHGPGVAFAPEIVAGCMAAHKGEHLVPGSAVVP
jgi:hypothetical protein